MVSVEVHRAQYVVPISAPVVENGAVAVWGGRIVAVGKAAELSRRFSGPVIDHGEGCILPALVNAHVHLEFSALKNRIPPTDNLGAWLEAALADYTELSPEEIHQGIAQGLRELRHSGTILAAEVSNTGQSLSALAASGLEFHYFYECLGFHLLEENPLAEDFPIFDTTQAMSSANFSAAAHAPYSTSEALFRRVQNWNARHRRPGAVHLAESQEEGQFIRDGNGFFRELLIKRGRRPDHYRPPGCSPTAYLDRLGYLRPDTLAVHGIWLDPDDLSILARRLTWIILCPRSNRFTGTGFPDLPALHEAGVRLALGTDSLASNADFNLFKELLCLKERYPQFLIPQLLALATINGAQALNRAEDLGSLTSGKMAALLFIPVRAQTDFWPALLQAGADGHITWISPPGEEGHGGH